MRDPQYERGGGAQKGSSSSMRDAAASGSGAAAAAAGGNAAASGHIHTRSQHQQHGGMMGGGAAAAGGGGAGGIGIGIGGAGRGGGGAAAGGGGGAVGARVVVGGGAVNPGGVGAAKTDRQGRTTITGGSSGTTHSCMSYDVGKVLGNGSFGVVTEARCIDTGEIVAIKKVLQDPRYKNRELDIMKELRHPNVVKLLDYFYTELRDSRDRNSSSNSSSNHHREGAGAGGAGGGGAAASASGGSDHNRFLNVVMEHIPETVYRVMKTFVRANQAMPFLLVKLYTYQMCRALGYLHALGICHRDIKPQNLLVDSRTHVLKLCDFGSAKRLIPGEQSVAYICSRFYRAPELMLGASEYTTAIDIWSIGCVLGELLLCRPLFAGDTSVDQLVKIIQVLGTPTRGQMATMNPNYTEFQFPDVKPRDWKVVFASHSAAHDTHNASFEQAINLLGQFLRYEPGERLLPLEALAHEFFDELRLPTTRLPGGGPLPELFTFSSLELQHMSPAAQARCIPPHIAALK